MTTYNTGNPIGSTAVKDLYDNAENLDVLVNDKTKETHPDRLGQQRKTWYGMEQDFQQFLIDSGYQNIGDYAAGLAITARNQIFWRDGELYRASAALELPYTTTGDWGAEEGLFVAVGDQALRQELASPIGSSMVGYGSENVGQVLDDLFDYAASGRIQGIPIVVGNVAELQSLSIDLLDSERTYIMQSYRSGSNHGGGLFRYTSQSHTEDGGTVFAHETEGFFVRLYEGPLMAEWFGAEPFVIGEDQDSTVAFQACADAAGRGGAWRWTGRHRITATVRIPFKQTFGSFGQMTGVSAELFDVSNYQGVHTSPYPEWDDKISSAVFFDSESGSAFLMDEGATATDFLIYGKGLSVTGWSTTDHSFTPPASDYYPAVAFQHGKYIRVKNVSVLLFDTAFRSMPFETGGSYVGDFYSLYENVQVNLCYTVFYVTGNGPTYNTKIVNPTINAPRFLFSDEAVRNFVVLGGSIEGFYAENIIRPGSEISFIGTYFETFKEVLITTYLNLFAGTATSISFIDCMVYLNNIGRFVSSSGSNKVHINSSGNRFWSQDGATSVIYNFNQAQRHGIVAADRISGAGASSVLYVNQAGSSAECLYTPPFIG